MIMQATQYPRIAAMSCLEKPRPGKNRQSQCYTIPKVTQIRFAERTRNPICDIYTAYENAPRRILVTTRLWFLRRLRLSGLFFLKSLIEGLSEVSMLLRLALLSLLNYFEKRKKKKKKKGKKIENLACCRPYFLSSRSAKFVLQDSLSKST